jgi:hypothetical protein
MAKTQQAVFGRRKTRRERRPARCGARAATVDWPADGTNSLIINNI